MKQIKSAALVGWSHWSWTVRWVGCFRQSNRCAAMCGDTPHYSHRSDVPGKARALCCWQYPECN